jgi:hypothetical protein
MQLKQYSCYCGMCSEKRYSECPHLATTRSCKHEPKKAGLARTRWLETGWVEYSMKLKEDTEHPTVRVPLRDTPTDHLQARAVLSSHPHCASATAPYCAPATY